ncbi:hypothetical protein AgCh_024760 [Apium graveolens]
MADPFSGDILAEILKRLPLEYVLRSSGLILLKMLSEYIDMNDSLSALSTEIVQRVVELLKFFNTKTCQLVLGVGTMHQEWHVTAIPDEIWDSVPQEVLTHLLFFYMDYHRHLERLEEERLEALR